MAFLVFITPILCVLRPSAVFSQWRSRSLPTVSALDRAAWRLDRRSSRRKGRTSTSTFTWSTRDATRSCWRDAASDEDAAR
jgi:hypothetical protein